MVCTRCLEFWNPGQFAGISLGIADEKMGILAMIICSLTSPPCHGSLSSKSACSSTTTPNKPQSTSSALGSKCVLLSTLFLLLSPSGLSRSSTSCLSRSSTGISVKTTTKNTSPVSLFFNTYLNSCERLNQLGPQRQCLMNPTTQYRAQSNRRKVLTSTPPCDPKRAEYPTRTQVASKQTR